MNTYQSSLIYDYHRIVQEIQGTINRIEELKICITKHHTKIKEFQNTLTDITEIFDKMGWSFDEES